MLKKIPVILLTTVSILEAMAVSSGDLREAFLSECSEQVYRERVHDKKFVSAVALKIVGHVPKECLKRFDEIKRYLVIENDNYQNDNMTDAQYRTQINSQLDAGTPDSFSTSKLSQQEQMRNVRGKTSGAELIESIKGFTVISSDKK